MGLPAALGKFVIPEPNSGCWIWLGAADRDGYGVAWDSALKRDARAHRLVYEILVGSIPKGKKLLHRCDTPCCVNPDHMFVGTTADNVADCRAKGRHAHGTRHGMNKLSVEQVLAIREMIANRETQWDIALKFGISPALVSHIKTGRLWKHLEDNYGGKL
jgi:HNH endonuclease